MVNRCPNCGGLLNYDIPSAQLKCESCDSLFSPEEYKDNTAAKENEDAQKYSVSVFTCPNCGGSISSNEAEAIEYCLYCGSFVTLNSQIEKVRKPDYIIPFSCTKEDCVKKYSKMIRRKLYAPKEFKDEKFLSGFKGVYIPYWTYNYEFGPKVTLDAVYETRSGDYLLKQHYNVECRSEGQINGISFDASSNFDDDISLRVSPFDTKKLKTFKSPYMFGFYADTADTRASLYKEDAAEIARDEIWDKVSRDVTVEEGIIVRPEGKDKFDQSFNLRGGSHLSMFPIWFLTWRNKDRVAYSVVNGESGAIYSEVPVDIKKYLLFSLIFAIPIFMLLNIFTFTASNMLTISMILSLFMMILYSFQLDKIVRKIYHADDKGFISKNKKGKENAEKVTDNILTELFKSTGSLFKGIGIGGLIFIVAIIATSSTIVIIGAIIFVLFIIIYSIVRIAKNAKLLNDGSVWRDVIGSLFSFVVSLIMLITDPAGDEFYYVAAIISIVGVGLSAVFSMRRYNELATRPVPHFFDRKAGGEE